MNQRIGILLLLGALMLPGVFPAAAEKYLTLDEAQRLLFPAAEKFETRTARFTRTEVEAIEARINRRVRHLGNRYFIARKDDQVLGVVVIDFVIGKHELIDYAVAIQPDGTVSQIEILEYRESYGYEIRRKQWRDQFRGKDIDDDLQINRDVFNISGATLSCRHVTQGVKRVLATWELVVRPRMLAAGELPRAATASVRR